MPTNFTWKPPTGYSLGTVKSGSPYATNYGSPYASKYIGNMTPEQMASSGGLDISGERGKFDQWWGQTPQRVRDRSQWQGLDQNEAWRKWMTKSWLGRNSNAVGGTQAPAPQVRTSSPAPYLPESIARYFRRT